MGDQRSNPLHLVGLLQFGPAFTRSITSFDCHEHLCHHVLGRSCLNIWFAEMDASLLHVGFFYKGMILKMKYTAITLGYFDVNLMF